MAYRGLQPGLAGASQRFPAATDLSRWSLRVCEGRQTWHYVDCPEERENPVASSYHVGLGIGESAPALPPAQTPLDSLSNAVSFFSKLQTDDGHWAGDYGGPMFLLPGYAIVMYITKQEIEKPFRLEMIRYLSNMQADDGGWGIHIESVSTVFGTALNYVVMRLLGVASSDERLVKARAWLQSRDGCLRIPSWGKFWLAVLNIYSWDGVNSLFPEMVLLPSWFPLHTSKLWSYCRTVYMPMTFLYGKRFQAEPDELILQLRDELLPKPFDQVDWPAWRSVVAEEDLYTPHSWLLSGFFGACNMYEKMAVPWLRERALDWIYKVIKKEDEFTNYICIGPVNKMMHMLCAWLMEGPSSKAFQQHADRVRDYLWIGRDGAKMNGTNGSQLWDTSFLVQGLIESSIKTKFPQVFKRANDFVDLTQIRVNHPEHATFYRDKTRGGWPFSTRDIGWVVADCTGEGLKAALICKHSGFTETPLSDDRLFDAVDLIIAMQNATGGYATCEKTRGWAFFEYFNASEVFGEIMIDYDYVECTSSCIQALCKFRELYPQYRARDVSSAIQRGASFMKSIQREDGSWEGMWGICFTYGIWFGVDGLVEAGHTYADDCIRRACDFLVSKQKEDGGWGETFLSCVNRQYDQHPTSQVVNTAWAILALLKAKYPNIEVIKRGVKLLMHRQLADGDWKQESICGVFNKNCMISYSNFKNIFPIWALCRFTEMYPNEVV